jgi:hypothetical protein
MTFIDHESRTVWNGSALDKKLSANVFKTGGKNKQWNNAKIQNIQVPPHCQPQIKTLLRKKKKLTGFLISLIKNSQPMIRIDRRIGGLLPEAQGEDYEEQAFANRMKKKKKNKRPGRRQ